MRTITYITLAFAPGIAGIIYFYLKKKVSPEFLKLLGRSYLLGMLGSVIVVAALFLSDLLGLSSLHNLKRTLFYCFVTVGLGSELSKFILYSIFIFPRKEIDRPMNGITTAVMNSMGFVTIFLVLFFFNIFGINGNFPPNTYSFTVVPANLLFALILGFFLGMARFMKSKIFFSVLGLAGSTLFHGIYLFCIISRDFQLLSLFAFFSFLIILVLLVKALNTRPESTV